LAGATSLAGGGRRHLRRHGRRGILLHRAGLADALAAIGDAPFTATGILVQDDGDASDGLLDDFQLWPRSAADLAAVD